MIDFLFESAVAPFTIALGILAGLLVLELVALLVGGSLFGGESDAGADFDADVDLDADLDVDAELDMAAAFGADLDADLAGGELAELPETTAAAPFNPGLTGWLGLGKMPFLIWLATMCLSFGLSGLGLQMALRDFLGFTLPAGLASLPALFVSLWFTRGFGAWFARVLPQTETSALSESSLGRRRGVVTQGTAARGRPAEVRVMDGYGNAHYLRAEPMSEGDEISAGTEVLVIRDRRAKAYVLVPVSE
jgi:hypothetical protein